MQKSGLSEAAYRRIVLASATKTKLQAKFQSELPATVPQAKIEVIQLDTKDDADKALARVKAGEDWASVAKSVSKESDVATTGGTHDYAPEGDVNTAYSGFAFSAAVGQISDVITSGSSTAQTFYVVRVDDRADKALTDAQKPAAMQRRYNTWLDSMRTKMTITDHWTNDQTAQANALGSVAQSGIVVSAINTAVAAAAPTVAAAPAASGTPIAVGTAGAAVPAPAGTAASQPTAGANQPVAPNAPVAPGGGNAP
ncbi:MAG TPA: peptidylprolyl isomerase [Casimicrobiaceae bacterium]